MLNIFHGLLCLDELGHQTTLQPLKLTFKVNCSSLDKCLTCTNISVLNVHLIMTTKMAYFIPFYLYDISFRNLFAALSTSCRIICCSGKLGSITRRSLLTGRIVLQLLVRRHVFPWQQEVSLAKTF